LIVLLNSCGEFNVEPIFLNCQEELGVDSGVGAKLQNSTYRVYYVGYVSLLLVAKLQSFHRNEFFMKIIGISSSKREESSPITQHRSFSRELLRFGLEYIKDKYSDVEIEIIDLGKYKIEYEDGAYSSDENFCQMDYPSSEDDMPLLYPKMMEADGVIFASPTYWGYPSALLKSFIERLTAMDEISDDVSRRRLQGKVAGAISVAKFDGSSRVAQDILSMANYLGFVIPPHAFAFHTGRLVTSVLEDDIEFDQNYFARRNAEVVAENVYLMVKQLGEFNQWRIFQEFTHPLSENEAKGVFDLQEERARHVSENRFLEFNKKDRGI